MEPALYSLLVDPITRQPLRVHSSAMEGDAVITGELHAENGKSYSIRNGIPRFVTTKDDGQLQTAKAFGFKWKRRDTYDSPQFKQFSITWLAEKYGFHSLDECAEYYAGREKILDVGCGSAYSSALWLDTPIWDGRAMWVGIDISEAVDVAKDRLSHLPNIHLVQADALALPFPDGSFDTIFSEGVLHHTPSTRDAILSAARVLAAGGEFHFYVYRKKGPAREFTDDYIREKIAPLTDEEAWDAMRSLTSLGKVLWETGAKVEIDSDIPLLGIRAGNYDVQRLIYWTFAKLYWNETLSFEENVHVNFDWYRPRYAHRQTEEEVRQWCEDARLSIHWFHTQESGFTVRATKR